MEQVLTEIEKAGDAANDAWLKDPQGPVIRHVAPVIAKLGEKHGRVAVRPASRARATSASTFIWAARSR